MIQKNIKWNFLKLNGGNLPVGENYISGISVHKFAAKTQLLQLVSLKKFAPHLVTGYLSIHVVFFESPCMQMGHPLPLVSAKLPYFVQDIQKRTNELISCPAGHMPWWRSHPCAR